MKCPLCASKSHQTPLYEVKDCFASSSIFDEFGFSQKLALNADKPNLATNERERERERVATAGV